MTLIPWAPIWVTLKLSLLTTVILLLLGTPLAWWLAQSNKYNRNRLKAVVEVLVALPLVLPPTVLGFYLLLLLSPNGFIGQGWSLLSAVPLVFSFSGLLIGSVIYSMPFVVQPLSASFRQVNPQLLAAAASLGAGPLDRFWSIVVPVCRRGFLVAGTLGFAHTVGEFGVVLMIGGNIPEVTQVLSIAIYDQVESSNYTLAHRYSAGLLVFSFIVLWLIYGTDNSAKSSASALNIFSRQ